MTTILFGFISRLTVLLIPIWSLRARTYWALFGIGASMRSALFKYLRFTLSDSLNRPGPIAIVSILAFGFIAFLNLNFSFNFNGTSFSTLNFIKLSKDSAKLLLSENLANAASVVGLSFVVLGFLFEIIRERTGRVLNELLKATFLYWVLSGTLIGLLYLVIFNSLKESLSNSDLLNIAISSTHVLIAIIVMIGFQFIITIRLFSSREFSKINERAIKNAALTFRFKERFIVQSKVILSDFFQLIDLGRYSSLDDRNFRSLSYGNRKESSISDVNLFMLRNTIRFLPGSSSDKRGNEVYLHKSIPPNYPLLYRSPERGRSFIASLFFRSSFLLTSWSHEDQFIIERENISNQLQHAAELGDSTELNRQLDIIFGIYKIYFDTRDL